LKGKEWERNLSNNQKNTFIFRIILRREWFLHPRNVAVKNAQKIQGHSSGIKRSSPHPRKLIDILVMLHIFRICVIRTGK